ncbi:hypothetical protein CI238_03609 [Colletotrichum incanum]|uniref:Uncharacterized protein n=1 Tax=Colletotrichum incanum TaxID=1573173 RepID=A0A166XI63_COLIC|nr:hypothetical protein CI238_03609 [Colletotrichum incanum]OHW99493.1 short chain dehydrogenase reductase family protein [Colletotrichum incanum]
MRFGSVVAFALLALGETGLCDRQESQSKLFSGSAAGRAAALVRPDVDKPSVQKRQVSFENGGISIGGADGLQLGGKGKGNGEGQASQPGGNVAGNRTANNNAGLTIGGVQLGGNKPAGGTGNSALDAFLGAANGGKKNGNGTANAGEGQRAGAGKGEGGPGANPGEAAKAEQGLGSNPGEAAKEAQRQGNGAEAARPEGEGQQPQPGQAAEGQPKAVEESEQFKENAGITLGADGQAQNIGGNLGITKGSDGSTSVGGKSGINISPRSGRGRGQNNGNGQQ